MLQRQSQPRVTTSHTWTLVPQGESEAIPLAGRENLVGRSLKCDVCLPSSVVSQKHAMLLASQGRLICRDLGSAHGTRLNGQLIETAEVIDGDQLQFGESTFVVGSAKLGAEPGELIDRTVCLLEFERVLDQLACTQRYSAVVNLDSHAIEGIEICTPARAEHSNWTSEQSVILHEEMRSHAALAVERSGKIDLRVFAGIDPGELNHSRMIDSLFELHERYPSVTLVICVPIVSVTNWDFVELLKSSLNEINWELAFDISAEEFAQRSAYEVLPKYFMTIVERATNLLHLSQRGEQLGVQVIAREINSSDLLKLCSAARVGFGQGAALLPPCELASLAAPRLG